MRSNKVGDRRCDLSPLSKGWLLNHQVSKTLCKVIDLNTIFLTDKGFLDIILLQKHQAIKIVLLWLQQSHTNLHVKHVQAWVMVSS